MSTTTTMSTTTDISTTTSSAPPPPPAEVETGDTDTLTKIIVVVLVVVLIIVCAGGAFFILRRRSNNKNSVESKPNKTDLHMGDSGDPTTQAMLDILPKQQQQQPLSGSNNAGNLYDSTQDANPEQPPSISSTAQPLAHSPHIDGSIQNNKPSDDDDDGL